MPDDTRGPQERAYDDIIRPAMDAVLALCQQHEVAMFAVFELEECLGLCGLGPMSGKAKFARDLLHNDAAIGAITVEMKHGKPTAAGSFGPDLRFPPMPGGGGLN